MVKLDLPANEDANKTADELTAIVLDHYIKHHKIIMKKLDYAQKATTASLRDSQNLSKSEISRVKSCENLWRIIQKTFDSSTVTEEDLQKIEHLLSTMPMAIRQRYETMVNQDRNLNALAKEINSEKYKQAYALICKLQAYPNLMSGLDDEECHANQEFTSK